MSGAGPNTEDPQLPGRAYPLPRPIEDRRFNMGLLIDVKRVLEVAGYPPIVHGQDLVELQLALFSFLYEPEDEGADSATKA